MLQLSHMLHYSSSEARKNFSELVNKVRFEKVIISIGRHNKDEVLLIPKPEADTDVPISEINATSSSFDFLNDEPDIYSLKDLKKRYV